MSEIVLRMKNIVKDFPGVRALDHVNFDACKGEVLALVGENGAGKSTLMKVLSGIWPYPTYEGEISLFGEKVQFANTRDAEKAGIGIIYQELNLIPELSVAENIFLDREFTHFGGIIDWNRVNAEAALLLKQLNITDIQPTDLIKELTVGKQQMIEIAKALSLNARILVLDEPTSALTDKEVDKLFEVIRKLKKEGVCMVYISHKMEEIQAIADHVCVLRDGKTIGYVEPLAKITMDEIITRMVGRDIKEMYPDKNYQRGKKTLEIRNFNVDHPFLAGEKKVKDISFDAYQGEILGIAGLMGAGRTELVTGIFGAVADDSEGEVYLEGRKLNIRSAKDAINEGIALVTEDRKILGLIMGQSVIFNTTISSLKTVTKNGIVNEFEERKITEKYVKDLGIKVSNIDMNIETLSGGNQQKVVIGKWLNTQPKVLILDEPTRGIDVGAKLEIYKVMVNLVEQGVTIIMISSDLPEIMGMSDRILVLCEGELVADVLRKDATREMVMEYATGNLCETTKQAGE